MEVASRHLTRTSNLCPEKITREKERRFEENNALTILDTQPRNENDDNGGWDDARKAATHSCNECLSVAKAKGVSKIVGLQKKSPS